MFVLSATSFAFGSINYNPMLNDCGCGCGQKDEPTKGDKKSKAIGDDDERMICEAR